MGVSLAKDRWKDGWRDFAADNVAGTVAMFVSKQVIEKLEGEQTRLRREVKYLRHAAERGDNKAVRVHAEDLASRLENHASLVDAVIEAVSEDSVSELP